MRPNDGASRSPRSYALPKEARIRKRPEFLALRHIGQRQRSAHFLFVRHREGQAPAQLGITVTKKIGNAVERNRIKRGVREAFRRIRPDLELGGKILVIAQRGAENLKSPAIATEISQILGTRVAP